MIARDRPYPELKRYAPKGEVPNPAVNRLKIDLEEAARNADSPNNLRVKANLNDTTAAEREPNIDLSLMEKDEIEADDEQEPSRQSQRL